MKKLNLVFGLLLLSSSALAGTITHVEKDVRGNHAMIVSLQKSLDGQTVAIEFNRKKYEVSLSTLKNAVDLQSIVNDTGSSISPYSTLRANGYCEANWAFGCAFDVTVETIALPITS